MKPLEEHKVKRLYKLIDEGFSRRRVAQILGLSVWCIQDYVKARQEERAKQRSVDVLNAHEAS